MIVFSEPTLPLSIQLRNPELSDTEEQSTNTLTHTAMNGDIRAYRRTPATTKLILVFKNLSRVKAMELRNFMTVTAGMRIQYVDHRLTVWSGFLLTDPLEIVTDGRGQAPDGIRAETNTVTLEFEGERL